MTASPKAGTRLTSADRPESRASYKQLLPWVGLFAILTGYALTVARLNPTNFFGLSEDDSIYFTSAKALAQGKGYIVPNLPGTPPATKYPILYPWLLSWVWRWHPSFPGNLTAAVGLNLLFGFAFLTITFFFLKQLDCLGKAEALLLTAFCALHPAVLFHTANLVSEIPFAAFSLGSILLAGKAVQDESTITSAFLSGIISGFSILLRVLGAPIAAGLCLAILYRRGWRRSAYFVAGTLPFLASWFWRSSAAAHQAAAVSHSSCTTWQTTWLYYTSYLGFWRADVLQNHALWHTVRENLILLLLQPGTYLVQPRFIHPALLAFAPAAVFSAAAIRGSLARIGNTRWQPVHCALALYVLPVLLWNYPVMERFLIPFLPLLAAAVWLEGRALMARIQESLRGRSSTEERAAALFLSAALLVLVLSAGWSWRQSVGLVGFQSQLRAEILRDKREAYSWLRENTAADTKVVAYEDAALYLYSGRQAIRPVIFSPAGAFRPGRLQSEVSCMGEVARTVGAKYWLMADDDFGFEWEPAITLGTQRERQLQDVLPLAFRSGGGHVRLYELRYPRPGQD